MKYLAFFLIGLALVIVVLSSAASAITDHAARAAEAQAAIEAARAAQIASAGQAISTTTLSLLVLGMGAILTAMLIGMGVLAVKYYRAKSEQVQGGKWVAGPNANYGQIGAGQQMNQLPMGQTLQQMAQMQMLQMLIEMQRARQAQLPPAYRNEDEGWDR